MKKYTELGFDLDNNRYGFGISSEIEYPDNSEERFPGLAKMKINEVYCRIWIGRKVLILSSQGCVLREKKRKNLKFVIGIGGY